MIIAATCKKCKSPVKTNTSAPDRVRLAMKRGEVLSLSCKKCYYKGTYQVDEFKAEPNLVIRKIALAIFVLGTPIMLYAGWDLIIFEGWNQSLLGVIGILLIPRTLYGIIIGYERSRVRSFNRHTLKRHSFVSKMPEGNHKIS